MKKYFANTTERSSAYFCTESKMKRFKIKITAIICSAIMALSLAGCGQEINSVPLKKTDNSNYSSVVNGDSGSSADSKDLRTRPTYTPATTRRRLSSTSTC